MTLAAVPTCTTVTYGLVFAGTFFGGMTLRMSLWAIHLMLGNMSTVVSGALITPLDALFEARSIFVRGAVLGLVPLVLLYWVSPISENSALASESPTLQTPF